jgi:hypothetical protein
VAEHAVGVVVSGVVVKFLKGLRGLWTIANYLVFMTEMLISLSGGGQVETLAKKQLLH